MLRAHDEEPVDRDPSRSGDADVTPGSGTPGSAALAEHVAFVRGVALAMVDDPELADDLSQEAILAALRRPPQLERDLRSWLRGVVRNLAKVHYRERARRTRREKVVAETRAAAARAEDPVDEAVGRAELRQRIARAVLELDEPYRSTLVLRFMENLTPTEIAATTGRPVSTVKTHLQRGLERLRTRFDGETGGRGAWQRAFLGLLLPLPVLLASASSASATTIALATSGNGASSGAASTGTVSSGVGGGSALGAGSGLGVAALVPLLLTGALVVAIVATRGGDGDGNPGRTETGPTVSASNTSDAPSREEPALTDGTGEVQASNGHAAPDASNATVATTARTVRVVDEAGTPLPGASITAVASGYWVVGSTDDRAFSAHRVPESAIVTDDRGLATVPGGSTAPLRVEHPAHLPRTVTLPETPADDASAPAPHEVVLRAGTVVEVAVVDARTRAPIVGARIHAAACEEVRPQLFQISVLTRHDPEDASVHVIQEDFTGPDLAATGTDARAASTERITGAREGGASVTLRFADVGGAAGSFGAGPFGAGLSPPHAITDDTGRALLRIDPERVGEIAVTAAGYADLHLASVDLAAEDPLTLPLTASASLRVTRSGPDLPARKLWVYGETADPRDGAWTCALLPEGESEVALEGLRPGAATLVDRRAPADLLAEGAFLENIPLTGRAGALDTFIRAEFLGNDAAAPPVAGTLAGDLVRTTTAFEGDASAVLSPESGSEAPFVFTDTTHDAYGELTAIPGSHIPVILRAGETTTVDLDARLGASLSVDLRDPDGTPCTAPESWRARIVGLDGTARTSLEREAERFRGTRLPVGPARVRIETTGGGLVHEETIALVRGDQNIAVTVAGGGLDIVGLPVGASVSLIAQASDDATQPMPEGTVLRTTTVPASGNVRWTALPAGSVTLVIVESAAPPHPGAVTRLPVTIDDTLRSIVAPPSETRETRLSITGFPQHAGAERVTAHWSAIGGADTFPGATLPVALTPAGAGRAEASVIASANGAGGGILVLSWRETDETPAVTLEVPVAIDGSGRATVTLPPWVETRIRARSGGPVLDRGRLQLAGIDPEDPAAPRARGRIALRLDGRGEGRILLPAVGWRVSAHTEVTHRLDVAPGNAAFELSF